MSVHLFVCRLRRSHRLRAVTKSIWIVVLMVRCFRTVCVAVPEHNNQQSVLSISRTGKYNNNVQLSVVLTLPLPGISIGASVLRYSQLPSSALASSHPRKHSVLNSTWNNYLANVRTLLLVGNMLFIVGDTFSACAMAYHLTKFKSWAHALPRSQPRRIDVLLNRLLIFAVATGALTSCVPFHVFTFDRRVLGRIALMHRTGS